MTNDGADDTDGEDVEDRSEKTFSQQENLNKNKHIWYKIKLLSPYNMEHTRYVQLDVQLDEASRIAGEEGNLWNEKYKWMRPAGVAIYINIRI